MSMGCAWCLLYPMGTESPGETVKHKLQGSTLDSLHHSLHIGICIFLKIYLNLSASGLSCSTQGLSSWCEGLSCPTCGILVPQPGTELTSLALEGRFLTTGPPGKSHQESVILMHDPGCFDADHLEPLDEQWSSNLEK